MTRYDAAVAWLYSLEAAKGMDFKLERVELALESLGNPQRRYPCVHIAGTNGKGSVAAMTQAMTAAAGYRVGLYTSPHLVRFTERIRVGQEEITADEVADLVDLIRSRATSRGIELTFFELATVMAFVHFATKGVDLAVVEVGLGGRLDATNVVDPVVAVITTIGIDHEEYLGNTVESIAAEKGGIIKPDRPTILGRIGSEARAVLAEIARQRGSHVCELGRDFAMHGEERPSYAGIGREFDDLVIGLRGAHQWDNAATALAAIELLGSQVAVPDGAVRQGLATVRWPGRLEIARTEPLVILDGAHNPDGVAAMIREVMPLACGRRVKVLFGVMRDKHWPPMARAIGAIADEITVTHVLPPRGESPERLAAACREWAPTSIIADPREALCRLVDNARRDEVVLVTGSLFLIGAVSPVLAHLTREQVAPSDPGGL